MKKMILTIICAVLTSTSFAYYQSEEGRWVSRDPIRETGGMNIYGFVDNASVNNIDHLGQNSWGSFTGSFMSPSDVQYQMAQQLAPPGSGGFNLTFLMTTYEITMDNGCTFHCIAWTPTTLFGANVFGGVGDALSPFSVGPGGTFGSVTTSGSDITVSGGANLSLPFFSAQARLDCYASGKDNNGCPCEDSEPPNVVVGFE